MTDEIKVTYMPPPVHIDFAADNEKSKDVDKLIRQINSYNIEKLGKRHAKKGKRAKMIRLLKVSLAPVSVVAAVAGVVSCIALLILTGGTAVIAIGGIVASLAALGALYGPVKNLIDSADDHIRATSQTKRLFKDIDRVKELINARLVYSKELPKDEQARRDEILLQRKKVQDFLIRARLVFPYDALYNGTLELL